MFASRAVRSTPGGHGYISSGKFITPRQINQDENERRRISELEEQTHPKRSLACAIISSIFCPILGFIALFYAIRAVRAYNEGIYAEAGIFYKKAIRWSLITFILGLIIGSIIIFSFFVKAVLFI